MTYKIIQDNWYKNAFRHSLFTIGIIVFISDLIVNKTPKLLFFALLPIAAGGLLTLFSAKRKLFIYEGSILYENKSIIDSSDSFSLDFGDIIKVRFLKKQFLLLGGRNPMADADAQTLAHQNRIVMTLNDNSEKVIPQIGELEDFKKAFAIIKKKAAEKNKKKTTHNTLHKAKGGR